MNRRTSLRAIAAAAVAAPAAFPQEQKKAPTVPPIHLHVDLEVDPAKEKEMVANYKKVFRPTIRKQPGFVEVKLCKFRKAMVGDPPKTAFYRLIISFRTEEERLTWVATDEHQRAWPTIENTLKGAKYTVWLYDLV